MGKVKVAPRVYAALLLKNRTPAQRVTLGFLMFNSMNGNLLFITPFPTLLELQTVTVSLQNAIVAAEGGTTAAKGLLVMAINDFDTIAVRMQEYVQSVANANPADAATTIQSSGLTLSKTPEKHPVPAPVAIIAAIFTNVTGTILVKWSAAKYARVYQLFMTTTPNVANSWTLVSTTTKRKFTVANLASNTRFYFRLVSIGVSGASAPSQTINNITNMD